MAKKLKEEIKEEFIELTSDQILEMFIASSDDDDDCNDDTKEIIESESRIPRGLSDSIKSSIESLVNDEDDEEDGKKSKKPPVFFLFKGNVTGVNYRSIKKWDKGEYFNGIQNVFTINLIHYDMDETVIEYHSLDARDAEYDNFLDKLRELKYILM